MAYRDDRDNLEARTRELEQELAGARREIERLRHRPSFWLGATPEVVVDKSIDGALDDEDLLRRLLPAGQLTREPDGIHWRPQTSSEAVDIQLATVDGKTRIRARAGTPGVRMSPFLEGFGTMASSLQILVILLVVRPEWLLPGFGVAVALTAAMLGLTRLGRLRNSRKRRRKLERLVANLEDALVDLRLHARSQPVLPPPSEGPATTGEAID